MKMVNGFFETAEKPTGEGVDLPPVMTGWKQATSVMGAGMEARIVEKSQASTESPQPIVTEEGKWTNKAERSAVPNEVSSVAREQSRAPESIMKTVNGSFETAEAPTGEGVEVPPVMTGLRQSTSVMGMDARNMKQNQESSEMQSPSDPVEPSALNHANQNLDQDYAMTNDTVEVKLLNEEENFAPQKAELVLSAETSTSQRVEGQGQSRIISGKQQSALDIASNTKNDDLSKNTDSENAKVQADSTHETQKISKHQHNVEFLPDMATTRSSVLKDAFASNLDSQKVSSDNRVMDTIVPEEVSSSLHDDIEKAQPSKSKPASFSSMKDSSIIDGVAVQSAETSNTADKEYSRSFMTAENPDNAGRSENDDPIQSSNPKFEDIAVNFAKEGDFAKMSKVDAASTIPLRENRVSQTEIVEQIMEKSVADIKSGRSEIRIDLKPENLGHIRLHVMTEQQHVSVKILAENAQVKEMIESQVSYIKNELQNQGINVNNVKVDFLTSGGSDFAYSQNESSAFRQARQESVYNGVKSHAGMTSLQEPDSPSVEQTATRGGSLVNYFA
jgi:flagellar hook-length control protein FliK